MTDDDAIRAAVLDYIESWFAGDAVGMGSKPHLLPKSRPIPPYRSQSGRAARVRNTPQIRRKPRAEAESQDRARRAS